MPQLDGYQVCEALRASPELKNVPILLLNGAFEPYDAERAKAVGALGNVSKPFDPPALVARVKEILSDRATAAFQRPGLETMETVDDEVESEEAVTHAFVYDESETHPVSTVEVPMGVRELAARSLTLDAPVFASAAPEVLTAAEEPSDFSETLHGPLDEGISPIEGFPEGMPEVDEVTTAPLAPEPMREEEMEAGSDVAPVAATGEFEAPANLEGGDTEPVEFDSDTAITEPSTLPPAMAASTRSPSPDEFAGEHEFESDEAPSAELPAAEAPTTQTATEPEPMTLPEERAAHQPTAAPDLDPGPAPMSNPPIDLPSPAAHRMEPGPAPGPGAGSFGTPVPSASASLTPSADVAVPMDMVQQIAQRVISQVSERVIREIAWDVIPGLAEKLIKAEIERIKARAESERD
jgi:hypothetical protein